MISRTGPQLFVVLFLATAFIPICPRSLSALKLIKAFEQTTTTA